MRLDPTRPGERRATELAAELATAFVGEDQAIKDLALNNVLAELGEDVVKIHRPEVLAMLLAELAAYAAGAMLKLAMVYGVPPEQIVQVIVRRRAE